MLRTILTGPAVLPAHASPLLHSRRFTVFRDKENEFTGGKDPAQMTEAEYRQTVSRGVQDQQGKLSTLIEEHGVLKKQTEEMRTTLADSSKTIGEQAAKIITLERSLLRARANREPGESDQSYFARAYPDECKAVSEALKAKQANFAVQKAESTTTLAPGQAVQFDSAIYSLVSQYGVFPRLDAHPMGAATENMIVETGEPDFVFVAENGEIPEVALALAPVGATAKKIGGILRVSNEALQDTIFDLGAYITVKFARAAARRADYVAFLATGANNATDGGFTGIASAGTVTPAGAGHTTIPAMTYDEVSSFMFSLGQAVLESNPVWFMNPVNLARFMSIKDSNGRPIFLNALEAPAYGAIGTLLGFPVVPVSVLPATTAAGQVAAIFGDPKAYAVGIRKDYSFDFSDHAGFTVGQRVYRGYMRGAWKIKDATKLGVLKTAAA